MIGTSGISTSGSGLLWMVMGVLAVGGGAVLAGYASPTDRGKR